MVKRLLAALVSSAFISTAVGCSATKQLEDVAKDWSLAIRASQVIPVYPLTEDLQPGDIFLVQTPIEQEVAVYESKGFLPMDIHLARLVPERYDKFYGTGFAVDRNTVVPKVWRFPTAQPATTAPTASVTPPPATQPAADLPAAAAPPEAITAAATLSAAAASPAATPPAATQAATPPAGSPATTQPAAASPATQPATDWVDAPHAAFPSYSFTVTTSGGLNLAVPVSGVPIGLSLMGSRNAHGTITLSDSYTYGIDDLPLLQQVRAWAKAHADEVGKMGPVYVLDTKKSSPENPVYKKQYNYLRVVSRVYLCGSMNVALTNDDASGGFLSAQPPSLLQLLTPAGTTASNYQGALDTLNSTIGQATTQPSTTPTIGGSIKIATASDRAVTLNETFPRPLIIGYLGFDLQIQDDQGTLGPLLPTQSRLLGNSYLTPPIQDAADDNSRAIESWLGTTPGSPVTEADKTQRKAQLDAYLSSRSISADPSDVINASNFAPLRASIVHDLISPTSAPH